jgi:peptide/histidine transporter 3/4
MEEEQGEDSPLVVASIVIRNEQQQRKRKFACTTILITEVLERIAFLSMAVTLGIFLNKEPLDWTSYNSIIATFLLIGTAFTFSFIGSILADTFLGRYKTICLSFLVYISGYIFFPVLDELLLRNESNENSTLPKMCNQRMQQNNIGHVYNIPHNSSHSLDKTYRSNDTHSWISMGNSSSSNITRPLGILTESTSIMGRSVIDENCAWPVYFFICLLAFGAGAVKANIAPYGAEHWKVCTLIQHLAFLFQGLFSPSILGTFQK